MHKMDIYHELNYFGTPEISDALDAYGIEGALLGIKSVGTANKIVGPAFTVKYSTYKDKLSHFNNAGNYIDDVPEKSVIVIDNEGRQDCTTWGNILTQVALIKKISGTIVHGAIRDLEFIRDTRYPVYSSGIYMRSGKNRVYKSDQQCKLSINGVFINPGDIIVGDSNGVIVIPTRLLNEVIKKIKKIRKTESKIIKSVKSGEKLEQARIRYNYAMPWLGKENND